MWLLLNLVDDGGPIAINMALSPSMYPRANSTFIDIAASDNCYEVKETFKEICEAIATSNHPLRIQSGGW